MPAAGDAIRTPGLASPVARQPGPVSLAALSSPQIFIPGCPQVLLSALPLTAYPQALRPVSPGFASSPRLPAPLLAGLSGSCGVGTEDGVPKFPQSTAEAVEVFGLFRGSSRVSPGWTRSPVCPMLLSLSLSTGLGALG